MEGVIQRTSSQTALLDTSNNNVGVEKLRSPKPPLLPKPQIIKFDSKVQKTGKISQVSPKITTEQNHSSCEKKEELNENVSVNQTVNLPVSSEKKVSKKPISSKPQLPPKLSALNSTKVDNVSNNSEVLPKTDINLRQSSVIAKTPPRPPRSPLKHFKKDAFTIKNGLLESAIVPESLILSKQKSSSLGRNESLNWTISDLISDSEQMSEFCKQVENCSKHSHILKKEMHSPLPADRGKKKLLDELDLASSSNLTKNEDDIRRDSVDYSERHLGKSFSLNAPKSFLHSCVNTHNQTKIPVENDGKVVENDEKVAEKRINVQSFLHKSKDLKLNLTLSNSQSPGQHDSEALSCPAVSQNFSLDRDQSEKSDEHTKSKNLLRPKSSEVTFGKRFPWFGSFGKGSKKDATKKERCFSQFYSSPTTMDEQSVLREKNRTKSLPNIKQTRVLSDDDGSGLKSNPVLENSEILEISSEYQHSDSDDDKDSLNQAELVCDKDSSTLAYLKAKELMTSEEVFIDVLKLLNVDFRNYVQLRNFESKNSCIPNGEVNKILNHLSQLQSLNEDILEDLRIRIQNWENNPKIADVIVKKGAFLKMYTTYIQNFESQTNYLDECIVKYPKFGKIVKEFESTERCRMLSLKHYMLKPVQRIPQYRLLLNDYLKYLSESSADYADTLSALKIVCDVVDHANRNMAHGDKEGRLMHFQSLLSDFELVKPGRELIKDGPLEKICRKTVKERYFILLNDCLLHTTYSKQYVKIHQELPLSGMKICYNNDQKYPPSFTVHSITKSFILCAKSEAECKKWVETLQKTIEEHVKRQKTFLNVKIEEDNSFKLGKEAPVWVQDSKVTMCQICTAEFTALFRRHHCRGCGKVVCRNCGSNQAPLQYRNFKPDKVCDQCFEFLLKEYDEFENSVCEILKETLNLNDESAQYEYLSIKAKFIKYTSASNWKKQKYIPPRLKEVPANDSQSVISGWLYRKSRKSWKMFWYVLKDHVLYVYKASEDVLASETIPVLGYEVENAKVNHEDVDKKLIFSLVHPRQEPIIFRAESQVAAERWFDALSSATNLDYLTL